MSLINDLQWRYATKVFSDKKVPTNKLQGIMDATALAASSYGLQPFTIMVVKNQELKIKLRGAAYTQAQLEQSSESTCILCSGKDHRGHDCSIHATCCHYQEYSGRRIKRFS